MKNKLPWIIKGFLIFAGIYFLSAVIVEGILIAVFSLQGYDMLHGEMPEGYITALFPLYGFAVFALLSVLFNGVIRKKKLADMQIWLDGRNLLRLPAGMAAGAGMVAFLIALLTLIKAYTFQGVNAVSGEVFLVTFAAYLVQGCSEEIMCRGLMQNYYEEKLGRWSAILLTALLFTAPHLAGIMDCSGITRLLSLLNLFLVSILFSLSMVWRKSLWLPAGIHVGWNFTLSFICGLEVSGGDPANGIFRLAAAPGREILHGGIYGIEAGVVTTVLLLACDFILYSRMKKESVYKEEATA